MLFNWKKHQNATRRIWQKKTMVKVSRETQNSYCWWPRSYQLRLAVYPIIYMDYTSQCRIFFHQQLRNNHKLQWILCINIFSRWWPRNSPRCYGVRQFFVVSNFVKRTFQTKAWKCSGGNVYDPTATWKLKPQTFFFGQFQLSNWNRFAVLFLVYFCWGELQEWNT